jgi:transposase-like protein
MTAGRYGHRRQFEFVGERARREDTSFDPDFIVYARKLALLGLPRREIARNLGCSPNLFETWVRDYPEFRRALDDGMVIGDFAVIEALLKRCTGYTQRLREWKGGNVVGEKEMHVPPDSGAIQFWLINRHSDLWKSVSKIETGAPTYGDINARPMVEFPVKQPELIEGPTDAPPNTAAT